MICVQGWKRIDSTSLLHLTSNRPTLVDERTQPILGDFRSVPGDTITGRPLASTGHRWIIVRSKRDANRVAAARVYIAASKKAGTPVPP